ARGLLRRSYGRAVGQDGAILLLYFLNRCGTDKLRLTDLDLVQFRVKCNAQSFAAWIAQADGTIHVDSGIEHVAQFVFVFGSHDLHVGQHTHKANIEDAVLGRTILAHYSGTIHSEDDVQILRTHIMHHLVEGALHKGGVDGNYRAQTTGSHTGGEGHAMLLSYAHIEVAVGQALVHLFEAGTFGHRRRNAHNALIFFININQGVSENCCVRWRIARVFLDNARLVIKRASAMLLGRIVLRELPTFAFFSDDLHNNRAFNAFDV